MGDGLCVVARTPSHRTLVVDCGTSSWRRGDLVGEKLTAPYLQRLGVDRVDALVLTHPHLDHVSGCAGLLQIKPASLVVDLGTAHRSPAYTSFLRAVRESGAIYRKAAKGQTLELGGGAVAEVLSPDPNGNYKDLNDRSIVLRVTYGNARILLMADAGEEVETGLLESGADLRSQVLLVGHHGSASASSAAFLAAVRPAVAVISCARNSQHGFPARDTLERLNCSGARVYVTGRHGAVTVTTDGEDVAVSTMNTDGEAAQADAPVLRNR